MKRIATIFLAITIVLVATCTFVGCKNSDIAGKYQSIKSDNTYILRIKTNGSYEVLQLTPGLTEEEARGLVGYFVQGKFDRSDNNITFNFEYESIDGMVKDSIGGKINTDNQTIKVKFFGYDHTFKKIA